MYLGYNLSEEHAAMPGGDAIQDPDVRRALQYAVDVSTICLQLLGVECERATGLVNIQNANPDLTPYAYDPQLAERLLDEAGWPRDDEGTRFSIRMQAGQGRYVNDVNVVLAVAQYLEDVGLDIELELMEWVQSIHRFCVSGAWARFSSARVVPVEPHLRYDRYRGWFGDELHALERSKMVRSLARFVNTDDQDEQRNHQ